MASTLSMYWIFSTGNLTQCSGSLSSYVFPSSICAADGTCSFSSSGFSNDAVVRIDSAQYQPTGTVICDGTPRSAQLAQGSAVQTIGNYACAIGEDSLQVATPCNSVQTMNIAEQSRSCDMLFYRSNNPARCLQMLGCDSSLESCVSYIGDTYTCDGTLQTRSGDTSYVCNCATTIQSAPTSDGIYTFAGGQVPESDGCGLPAFAAAVSGAASSVPSTTSAFTPEPITVTSTVQTVSTQTLQASVTPSSQSPSSSVQAFSFGLSVGAKAGFAVGIAAGVAIIGLVGYLLYRRRRQSRYPEDDEGHHYILRRELSPVVCEKLDEGKFVYLVNRRH